MNEVAPLPDKTPKSQQSTAETFLSSPDIQKAIAQIPDLIKVVIESKASTTKGTTKGILWWTFALAAIIIIPVSILSWFGKISADAATFLFGTIIGVGFSFLRDFFPRTGGGGRDST